MPNPFAIKAHYLERNAGEIEVLIIGSSHHQNGLNPEFFSEKTCNLAYGSQDIQLDSALVFHNIEKLTKLKKIVFELDPHRIDLRNDPGYFRYPWYHIYYGIDVVPIPWISRFSLYSSNVLFFNDNLIADVTGKSKQKGINEFGYVYKNHESSFRDIAFDSVHIKTTEKERLVNKCKPLSPESEIVANENRIRSIVDYCKAHNIELFFLTSPVYKTYRETMPSERMARFHQLVAELKKQYGIHYLDSSSDPDFKLTDFADDDHLNPDGAKKYSKKVDLFINNKLPGN
ncbi:MAG: hypothetical protein EOO48_07500 [Flavobacterium sp.]|nr:MAG: hypothetical protein EOO48_07500 [Flavobacterium sp.]